MSHTQRHAQTFQGTGAKKKLKGTLLDFLFYFHKS
jgi:hypothetical protein